MKIIIAEGIVSVDNRDLLEENITFDLFEKMIDNFDKIELQDDQTESTLATLIRDFVKEVRKSDFINKLSEIDNEIEKHTASNNNIQINENLPFWKCMIKNIKLDNLCIKGKW
ncbi:MAG: hypothetical protein ACRCUP_01330 [Mycoplasmatales bacterium]